MGGMDDSGCGSNGKLTRKIFFTRLKGGSSDGKVCSPRLGRIYIDSNLKIIKKRCSQKSTRLYEFRKDYHQASSKKAQINRFTVYFEQGFLWNVDRELSRIDTGYEQGSIFKISGEIMMKALGEAGDMQKRSTLQDWCNAILEFCWD